MRVVAVVFAIAVCSCRAHERAPRNLRSLLTALDVQQNSATARLVNCVLSLGLTKCASALGAWRAGKAVKAFSERQDIQFNLTADVEQFPWERYQNVSDETLHTQLSNRTQKLLQHRPLTLTLPGYEFRLKSNGYGKLNVDVYRSEISESGRATKKMRKQFYQILPFLVVPGLLIYAALPLILPGLKMMTMASGLVNSLAFAGAVYMYLRNHGSSSYQNDKKVTVIDVSYGLDGKRVPNHYYSESSHHYNAVEPNSIQVNDDLSSQEYHDWSSQNLMPSASQQSVQYATENSLLTSYLNMQSQPKIRIAFPSLFQQKAQTANSVQDPMQLGIKYPQLQTNNQIFQQPNQLFQRPTPVIQQPTPFIQQSNPLFQQSEQQFLQHFQQPFVNHPNRPVQQKVGLSYPNNQIQHGVELAYASQTIQPEPEISYSTEPEIPDIGIDLNQNQIPHIDSLNIENGELQQKMEMSYLKGLQEQQVRIANEQSKQNLDTSYPIEQLGDQIRRSGDDSSSSTENTSNYQVIESEENNITNTTLSPL